MEAAEIEFGDSSAYPSVGCTNRGRLFHQLDAPTDFCIRVCYNSQGQLIGRNDAATPSILATPLPDEKTQSKY